MTDYSPAVQVAVLAALGALAGGRVYDAVPEGAGFPYIEVAGSQLIPDDTTPGDGGISENIDIHVWSRSRGWTEVKTIMGQIYDALHGVSLSVAGRASALSWVRNTHELNDPNGLDRHGIMSVEIVHRT